METNASVSKQARLRGGMAWILSFLICLFLTVLSLLSLLECTLLSPGFLKKQVDKSAYTAHVIEDMEDIFVSYGISSDFDEAFFTSVLTEEEVRADIYAEIDRLYAADATGADYGAFESQLYDKLTANVKERNLEITESVDQALHYLAQMCAETYREGVGLPFASYAASALAAAKTPLLIGIAAMVVLSLFVLGFLFALQKKNGFFRYAIYACSGAAVTLTVLALVVLLSGKIEKIGLTGKALYYLVTGYATQTVMLLFVAVGILLAAVLILALLYGFSVKRAVPPPKH